MDASRDYTQQSVGGLKVDGFAKRGIVNSSAAYAEGTGEINVLPPPFAVSIK